MNRLKTRQKLKLERKSGSIIEKAAKTLQHLEIMWVMREEIERRGLASGCSWTGKSNKFR